MKALGTGWRQGITWHDLEVSNANSGKPSLKITGKAQEIYQRLGGTNIVLSITHTEAYAMAQVIFEGPESRS